MKLIFACVLVSGALSRVAASQTQPALVTFYSAGCQFCTKEFFSAMFAGSVTVPYGGPIYDGKQKLIKNLGTNHFVTLRMQPGPHSFAGNGAGVLSLRMKRAKGRDLPLTLQPGQHYFVSLLMKDTGVTYDFRRMSPIVTEKDCRQAFKEAAQTEPIRPRWVGGLHIGDVQPSVYFPACGTD